MNTANIQNKVVYIIILFISFAYGVKANDFPVGVYDKYAQPNGSEEWFTYYENMATFFVENSINSVVLEALPPGGDPKIAMKRLDIFHQKNIKVVQTIGNALNKKWDKVGFKQPFHKVFKHPAIIAYKYGDEPKDAKKVNVLKRQYAAIQKYYRAPVITAIIGELLDGNTGFTEDVWQQLNSQIKFARYYNLRREYAFSDFNEDKTKLRFDQWCEYLEDAHNGKPWWFIAQTFGRGREKSHQSYWRLPTSAEMNAQLHLALANGARGIFGFALQPFGNPKNIFLVDNNFTPTKARDNSVPLKAFSKVAKLINKHEEFYLNHKETKLIAASNNDDIYVAIRHLPKYSDKKYIYVINKNVEDIVKGQLSFADAQNFLSVINKFSGESRDIIKNKNSFNMELFLNPGEAQLWELLY